MFVFVVRLFAVLLASRRQIDGRLLVFLLVFPFIFVIAFRCLRVCFEAIFPALPILANCAMAFNCVHVLSQHMFRFIRNRTQMSYTNHKNI